MPAFVARKILDFLHRQRVAHAVRAALPGGHDLDQSLSLGSCEILGRVSFLRDLTLASAAFLRRILLENGRGRRSTA